MAELLVNWLVTHKHCRVTLAYNYDTKGQDVMDIEMVVPINATTSICIKEFHIYEPSDKAIVETLDRMYKLAVCYD